MKLRKYILAGLASAVFFYIVTSLVYDTPQQRIIRKENRVLSSEMARYGRRLDIIEDVLPALKAGDARLYHNIFSTLPPEVGDSPAIHRMAIPELEIMTSAALSRMDSAAAEVSAVLDSVEAIVRTDPSCLSSVPSILPIPDFNINGTGASVGLKFNPFFKTVREHQGIDLMAPVGTEVVASAPGIVSSVGRQAREFGNIIIIMHPGGYHTTYANLDVIKVRVGQELSRGDVIGEVGSSGRSLVPHLHYEVIKDSLCVEPVHYFFGDLNVSQYNEMLTRALTNGQSMD